MMRTRIAATLILISLAGCGDDDPLITPPAPVPTATQTATVTPTPSPLPSPTPGAGANIVFVGVLRADETLLDPSGVDDAGRPVYMRPTGSGFELVIEAKPGTNGAAVGASAFQSDPTNPAVRPDLQIEVSRDLGNGSPAVCDNNLGNFGGVPGIDPPSFDETQRISDALNDLGCRINDGTGTPQGRRADSACVLFPDGQFHFVDPTATIEFCAFITHPLAFPLGDTIVTVRVRDQSGQVGPARQIVIRVTGTPGEVTPTPNATPTVTPTLGSGANIGFMGVLRADETLVDSTETDASGRAVFVRPSGSGFVLVIDAKPGTDGAAVGNSAFNTDATNPATRPDLQIEVSRDLGDGSPAVCDNTAGNFGGVPAVNPPRFDETQSISDALNDLGCRFNDGAGNPQGRGPNDACGLFPDGEFRFVDTAATTEFCVFIARPFAFPDGDTIVTARVRDVNGQVGPERQIVVRVSAP